MRNNPCRGKAIDHRYGRLDVLINNAGITDIADPAHGLLAGHAPTTADFATVRAVFETNIVGVMAVTNAMLPLLRRSPAPRIVNISSGVGSLSVMADDSGPLAAIPASAAYVPSKTALNSLTVQYAKELRDTHILINAADPGPCGTDLNPAGKRTAADGARIAVRLATLGPDGPTGGFFNEDGVVPW